LLVYSINIIPVPYDAKNGMAYCTLDGRPLRKHQLQQTFPCEASMTLGRCPTLAYQQQQQQQQHFDTFPRRLAAPVPGTEKVVMEENRDSRTDTMLDQQKQLSSFRPIKVPYSLHNCRGKKMLTISQMNLKIFMA